MVGREDQVVLDRETEDQTETVPVSGDESDPGLAHLPNAGVGDVLAVEDHCSSQRFAQPGDCLDQLVLSVAGHTGDSQNLTGAQVEVHAADDFVVAVVANPEILHAQHRIARV